MYVFEEAMVVLVGVVKGRCGDENMILWPGVLKWQHPWISRCHPLLLTDLYVGNHWDAVVFTWNEYEKSKNTIAKAAFFYFESFFNCFALPDARTLSGFTAPPHGAPREMNPLMYWSFQA